MGVGINNFFSLDLEKSTLLLLKLSSEVDLGLSNSFQEVDEIHRIVVPFHSIAVELLSLVTRDSIFVSHLLLSVSFGLFTTEQVFIFPFLE